MSVHQIVAVAVRLFALWLVMISLQVGAIAAVMNKNLDGGPVLALYFLPVVSLFVAAFLWRFPLFVARRLVPGTADTKLRMAPRDATAAASTIIGLWALIASIPHLATALGFVLATGAPVFREPSFYFGRPVDFLAALVQCLLGLFLVNRPWFVARRIFAFVRAQRMAAECRIENCVTVLFSDEQYPEHAPKHPGFHYVPSGLRSLQSS